MFLGKTENWKLKTQQQSDSRKTLHNFAAMIRIDTQWDNKSCFIKFLRSNWQTIRCIIDIIIFYLEDVFILALAARSSRDLLVPGIISTERQAR